MAVAGKGHYSQKTLLGNWYEQRLEAEGMLTNVEAEDSYQSNQLKQFESKLNKHLQTCTLSDCSNKQNGIKYGDKIMISSLNTDSVISTDGQEKIYVLNDECRLATASSVHTKPVLRNTFIILPCHDNDDKNGKKIGDSMKYGDQFMLCINDELVNDNNNNSNENNNENDKKSSKSKPQPFYLHSEPISQWSSANSTSTRAQQVVFHSKKDANAIWSFHWGDNTMRFEYDYTENVQTNKPIVIQHCFTKQFLACNKDIQGTDFGNEYELSCAIYNPKGRISSFDNENKGMIGDTRQQQMENLWKILDSNSF